MRGLLCAAFVVVLGPGLAVAERPNTLTPAEEKAGWSLLFDGQSLEQFRGYQTDDVPAGWAAEDGAIRHDPAVDTRTDLMTREQFGDFELSLDYRISPGGNSGLMFRVTEQGQRPWHTGPEIQILDNAAGQDPQKAGWLYGLQRPSSKVPILGDGLPGQKKGEPLDATRPAGEWNTIHLRLENGQGELNLNGVRYYTFRTGTNGWDKKVAASKFAQLPGFAKAERGHLVLQDHGDEVAFRSVKVRRLGDDSAVSDPVDRTLAVRPQVAFPGLAWEGWQAIDEERGLTNLFIPVLIENAGDGSNRLFVADQRGIVYVFDNRPDVTQSTRFMDITQRTVHNGRLGDEQGLLGLAFHPHHGEAGHPAERDFFVYYTEAPGRKSVISRFRTLPDDPNRFDPDFEEVLFRADQPFANHNGGTLAFGNDGHLYIAFGDGGAFYDPYNNAQDLSTPFGSVLRIDVDNPGRGPGANGKPYGVPADNPLVDTDGAMPEIYAYGFRNPWRLTNDPETGRMWVADVGQNLWEEIDVLQKGGNYGWNFLEATHRFGGRVPAEHGVSEADLIPPVWEYDHQIGKSITGGMVYRGTSAPALAGHYVYADYVTGKLFALAYEEPSEPGGPIEVTGNVGIPSAMMPVVTFGRDEAGEVYFGMAAADGRGVFKFVTE